MFRWSEVMDHFRKMRRYIAFGFVLFFAGVVVGGTNPSFEQFIEGQIEGLRQIATTVERTPNPALSMFVIIFLNNAIKSIMVMYLGVFFGLFPLMFLIVNGMVIGYFINHMATTQGWGFAAETIAKGILPHGIIEIPAIIIASAYGLKFGTLALRLLGAAITRNGPAVLRETEVFVKRTVPLMVWLVVSLLAAAVIETTLSRWLLTL
ncbi:membrane protein [Paenibacillus sp. 32O-W]|jgi:Uncharacterized membrane protein|uniref:stage II sporulation protein M n=1 Tax=Paenibacillus sp. 32O-W TaxID=1695218 RepID=UPI0007210AC6|nr:stage II sporulation protein M [Paenibacillus sp. 32O-W]ALS26213.1 membrane protein [Paenibacillus sp. 32O-W]